MCSAIQENCLQRWVCPKSTLCNTAATGHLWHLNMRLVGHAEGHLIYVIYLPDPRVILRLFLNAAFKLLLLVD